MLSANSKIFQSTDLPGRKQYTFGMAVMTALGVRVRVYKAAINKEIKNKMKGFNKLWQFFIKGNGISSGLALNELFKIASDISYVEI